MTEVAGFTQTVVNPISRYCAIIQQTTTLIATLVYGQLCHALRTYCELAGSGHGLLIVFGRWSVRFSAKAPTCVNFHVLSYSTFGSLVLRESHSNFQSQFYTQCDLVLPLSIYNIPSFPEGHPVAAYIFFIVFPSLVSFPLYSLQYSRASLNDGDAFLEMLR